MSRKVVREQLERVQRELNAEKKAPKPKRKATLIEKVEREQKTVDLTQENIRAIKETSSVPIRKKTHKEIKLARAKRAMQRSQEKATMDHLNLLARVKGNAPVGVSMKEFNRKVAGYGLLSSRKIRTKGPRPLGIGEIDLLAAAAPHDKHDK
eukprot:m51a1_g2704 hypothetical protein (152) ;mRNA; f:810046-810550